VIARERDVREVRIGVVGVGHLGRHHARLLASTAGARLVGVADISPERAQAAATAHGCPSFSDYRAFLGQVDAVSIAVPTVDHLRVARDFLTAGCLRCGRSHRPWPSVTRSS
jgi:predicted dehydrogenase